MENYSAYDEQGWPELSESRQRIRAPGKAVPINTPAGCFGKGPGALKTSAGFLNFNTSSFISYAQSYEFTLIVEKDVRRAMVTLEIDVGSIPAPIVEAECLNADRDCFPMAGGVMVNPTSRLAVRGKCLDECEGGDLSYFWTVLPAKPVDHRLSYVRAS